MSALLKRKNSAEPLARAVYAKILSVSRLPVFYTGFGVADTFSARFDLLMLHAFLLINRFAGGGAEEQSFNQSLFDALFADMDQGLREKGFGDMGIPKRMKKMMQAFNGRMHAYQEALTDDAILEETLRRNLYAAIPDIKDETVKKMKSYIHANINLIASQSLADLEAKGLILADPRKV